MSDKGLLLVNAGNESLPFLAIMRRFIEENKKGYPQPILYGADFIAERVYRGDWQLWFVHEDNEPKTMMLTYVQLFPAGKMCVIELVVGEGFFDFSAKAPIFEAWAKSEGVSLLYTATPAVLAKRSERYGWRQGNVNVYKWLEERQ